MPQYRLRILALIVLALLIGCSDDSVEPLSSCCDGFPFADSADVLMENFARAYGELDAVEYRDMIDSRYRFYDVESANHNAVTEIRIIEAMFSGNPPTNPAPGSTAAGIRSVEVVRCSLLEPWVEVSESHPDFGGVAGARRGFFDTHMKFLHDSGNITVNTHQFFYAVPVTVIADGVSKTEWKMLGQEDVELKAGNEDMSWSGLKFLFRP